ncbi:hypothetical protein GLOIN_2v1786507 [Rhizophagus clarus]|uniref:CCHC-type domain-containing protein n=1 Tax=Rhizophagus clarus TaxID=94130 RepID=A0A8H3KR37_9GLOM|nr:hypothetical protein GLOIN_2v1786507 [Rhizophagus clarus]
MTSKKNLCNANKAAKNQSKVVVPIEKPIVTILASSITSNTLTQLKSQVPPTRGPSVTVKKEIVTQNVKLILEEEQTIAKKMALVSNLDSERFLADRIMSKQVATSVKKKTMFTCYASDSNKDATNINQQPSDPKIDVDLKLDPQQVMDKPVIEPKVITLSDDEDSFYPDFEYAKPAHQSICQENGKNKLINIVNAIFSNEDSYNKVLQGKFHTKINEEDQDGNIVENDITFQFKSVMKEKPQKNEEEINNEKIQEQSEQHKQHSLRPSGLPVETTAINLKPIIDEINAMTCFIPRNPYHYKLFSYAYVNFKNEEDKEITMKKKFSIKQGKTDETLFISDPTIKCNICNNCGNPDHLYAGCNIKKHQNKCNNMVKAAWKERSKLTAQNKSKSYAQAVNLTKKNDKNQNKNNFKGKHSAQNNNPKGTPSLDNLVKTLEVQITQQFTELRSHIDQFSSTINQFRKEREERLKNVALVTGSSNSPKARSPTLSPSSPKNEKNEQHKRVIKDSDHEDSSSSKEE